MNPTNITFFLMKENYEPWKERSENEILFSRVVKAGKRVYYLDVKSDRNDEYYISMTESKRIKDGNEGERPVFEKHKIFLYREDIIKFLSALTDAAQFVGDHRPLIDASIGERYDEATGTTTRTDLSADFNVEF